MNGRRGLELSGKGKGQGWFSKQQSLEEVELVWITTIARRTNAISTKFYMGFLKAAQGLAGHFCVYDTKKFMPRGVDWGRVETDSSNFLAALVQLAYGT